METQEKLNGELVTVTQNYQENLSLQLITKAELDVAISTAKAYPRSIKQFMDKAMSIATVNEEVAASCNYAVPRQGKSIEGPSVRLAEIVCSAYGNIRSAARVIDNDGKMITAQGVCHDLETNNSVSVEVKRRITGKDGRTFSEDMQVVTGNAACAIAFRNAVFKVIPAALIDGIYEETKRVARGNAETLVLKRNKALDYFRSLSVKDEQICEVLGIKKVEDIDIDKLSLLRGMASAIKNGESTVADIFEKQNGKDQDENKELNRLAGLIKKAKDETKLNAYKKDIASFNEADQKVLNEVFMDRLTELETPASNA
jgi:hypothetical protein